VVDELSFRRLEDPVKPKNTRYLILAGLVLLAVVVGLLSLNPLQAQQSWLTWLARGAALFGYSTVFLSILSSAYLRELVRFFGRSFVKVHHVASVTGLVVIGLHPVVVAVNTVSAAVFVPRFDSLLVFFTLGGRLAWYFIGVASLAALFRMRLRNYWRAVHYLNYVAFLLASIHASLLGTTFLGWGIQGTVLKAILAILVMTVVYVFVRRRMARRPRQRRTSS
jgi:sulfoxide reductase heme-binding subunit YedZ